MRPIERTILKSGSLRCTGKKKNVFVWFGLYTFYRPQYKKLIHIFKMDESTLLNNDAAKGSKDFHVIKGQERGDNGSFLQQPG